MQALLGWLTIMAMVFGSVGVMFFILSAIRSVSSLVCEARRGRQSDSAEADSETVTAR